MIRPEAIGGRGCGRMIRVFRGDLPVGRRKQSKRRATVLTVGRSIVSFLRLELSRPGGLGGVKTWRVARLEGGQ